MAVEKSAEPADSFVTRTSGFVSGSIEELRKVSTPTKQETMQVTFAVMFIIVFVSICLFLLDMVLSNVMRAII